MKKILIIDDDQFILKVYQKKFETEGLLAEVAADGPAALQALKAGAPELILLDLMMPGMSGVELLGHIRAIPGCADVPVLVFSHTYDEKLVEGAKAAGATQCLNKNSVSPNRLMDIVRAALAAPRHRAGAAADAMLARSGAAASSAPDLALGREDLRTRLAAEAATIEARLHQQLQALSSAPQAPARVNILSMLRDAFHRLATDAHDADLDRLAVVSRAVVRMLDDLRAHPEEVSAGTFRTVGRVLEILPPLFTLQPTPPPAPATLAAVVHPQRGIAPLLADSLRAAGQPAIAFRDAGAAFAFLEENPVDLLIVALELAQPATGDFVRRAHAIPGRANVPVILLSSTAPGGTPVHESLVAHQMLAFPYTAEEVMVTAIVRLMKHA